VSQIEISSAVGFFANPVGFRTGDAATALTFLGFFEGLEAAAAATFRCLAMAVKKLKTRSAEKESKSDAESVLGWWWY
jgi:hypothetical protein